MKQPEDCSDLLDVREAIDQIDHSIVEGLALRMKYVHAASRFKPDLASIPAPERVSTMLVKRGEWAAERQLEPAFIKGLFSSIIHWYIAQQIQYRVRQEARS